jgi:hypothetical protein
VTDQSEVPFKVKMFTFIQKCKDEYQASGKQNNSNLAEYILKQFSKDMQKESNYYPDAKAIINTLEKMYPKEGTPEFEIKRKLLQEREATLAYNKELPSKLQQEVNAVNSGTPDLQNAINIEYQRKRIPFIPGYVDGWPSVVQYGGMPLKDMANNDSSFIIKLMGLLLYSVKLQNEEGVLDMVGLKKIINGTLRQFDDDVVRESIEGFENIIKENGRLNDPVKIKDIDTLPRRARQIYDYITARVSAYRSKVNIAGLHKLNEDPDINKIEEMLFIPDYSDWCKNTNIQNLDKVIKTIAGCLLYVHHIKQLSS